MAYKLDLKDKKLLYELDLNSRQTFSELAKKIKLSKNSVSYRVTSLQKEGIIKQFYTVVDTGKLGYINFKVYLDFEGTTPEKEDEIIDFLGKKDSVTWIMYMEGKYNICFSVSVKSVAEFDILWKELFGKYLNNIGDRRITIMTDITYFSKAYLIEAHKNEFEVSFSGAEKADVDEKDIQILRLLSSNSRMPIIDIAEKVDIAPKTAISRIKILEEKKVIVGYRTALDLEKIGYQEFNVELRLHNINEELKKDFLGYIKSNPNTMSRDDVILGGEDMEIDIQAKGMPELRKIIDEIKQKFSRIIQNYSITQFCKEHKCLFFPLA